MKRTCKRWTKEEDSILIHNVEENIENLTKAFKITAKAVNKDWTSARGRWYMGLSNPQSKSYIGTCFLTISRKRYNTNRKQTSNIIESNQKTKGEKFKFKSLWFKIINLLKLN